MDRKFLFLVLVFFLVFGTFGAALIIDQNPQNRLIRATQQCEPSAGKSFLTSFPKTVSAGEACEINAFVRCDDESSITGAEVSITVTNGTARTTTSLTDESGRAVFTVDPTGLAEITATVNGSLLIPNTVTCEAQ